MVPAKGRPATTAPASRVDVASGRRAEASFLEILAKRKSEPIYVACLSNPALRKGDCEKPMAGDSNFIKRLTYRIIWRARPVWSRCACK
jgi:hypothetical protein